jgi:hypothetical protein
MTESKSRHCVSIFTMLRTKEYPKHFKGIFLFRNPTFKHEDMIFGKYNDDHECSSTIISPLYCSTEYTQGFVHTSFVEPSTAHLLKKKQGLKTHVC